MKIDQKISERLRDLSEYPPEVREIVHQKPNRSSMYRNVGNDEYTEYEVDETEAYQWGISCLNILKLAFGIESDHYSQFNTKLKDFSLHNVIWQATGIMKAAAEDYSQGFSIDLRTAVSGEIFQDFVALAKRVLAEGNKDVAAVLASAALEDTLKRYAEKQGLNIDDKDLAEIVNTLKSQGLVGGTLKNSLAAMVKIRNCAMHADWSKISEPEVSSLTAFVEQFLITYF